MKFSKVDIHKPDIEFYYPSAYESASKISTADYIEKYTYLINHFSRQEYIVPFDIDTERLFVRLAFVSTRKIREKGRSIAYPFTSMCLDRQEAVDAFTNVFYIMKIYKNKQTIVNGGPALCIKIGTTMQDLKERYKYTKDDDTYYFPISKTAKLPMKLICKERYTSKGNLEKVILSITTQFIYRFPEEYCNHSIELRTLESFDFIKENLDDIIEYDYHNFVKILYYNENFKGQLCKLVMLNNSGVLVSLSESLANVLTRVLERVHNLDRRADGLSEPRYINFFKKELIYAKRELTNERNKRFLDDATDMYSKLLASLRHQPTRGESRGEHSKSPSLQNNTNRVNNTGTANINSNTFKQSASDQSTAIQVAALAYTANTVHYTAGNSNRTDQLIIYDITVAHGIHKFIKILHTEKYFTPLNENIPDIESFTHKVIEDFNKSLHDKIPALIELVLWFIEN
jgi:hypothetical protein